MATRTVSTKIKLDGEKEYKEAISSINSGLSVLNSEMKKVSTQYQDNANSVEALNAKNDVLQRTLTTQKEKVEALRTALANSVEQYGEADSRTMKWQTSLNNAEAAVYNTEAAIRANNEALEQAQNDMNGASESAGGLGTALDTVAQKFGVSVPDGAKKALDSVGTFSTKGIAAIAAVTAAVVALVNEYKNLIEMTTQSASLADEIITLNQITGLTTDTIQELQYSSELIDVSFDTVKSSLTKLKRAMEDAQSGNEDLTASFTRLGVRINDAEGNFRDVEDVFYEVIDALGQMENSTDRDTTAMNLMGKKAEDLNPLIKQGSEVLREYAEEAHNVGAVMSEEELSALGAVDDAYQRLQLTQQTITNQISIQMAPAVEKFYTQWTKLIKESAETLVESGIIKNLGIILEHFSNIIEFIMQAENEVPILTTALNGLSAILGAVAQFCSLIADAADLIKSLFTLNFSGVANALGFGYSSGNPNNYQKTYMQQEGTWDQYAEYYGISNASGNYNFEGGWTRINENGTEMAYLPQGTRILNAQETREQATGDTYNITIDAKNISELNDIVRIVKYSRMTERMRG